MKVKTILVSQPEQSENSPYNQIIDKYKVKIDFKPFVEVQGMRGKDLRTQKIDLHQYTAIILTSRKAVDHYFRVAEEMRFKVPDTMKYFCLSETVAFYLQKYITYRKRKIYVGKREFSELVPTIKKHKEETYLLPSSDILNPEIETTLNDLKINWKRGIFYKTVYSNLASQMKTPNYDIIVFFSPAGVESLFKNFPNFQQNKVRIATFGDVTLKAAENAGLKVDIQAPAQETPSMTKALEFYLERTNGKR